MDNWLKNVYLNKCIYNGKISKDRNKEILISPKIFCYFETCIKISNNVSDIFFLFYLITQKKTSETGDLPEKHI